MPTAGNTIRIVCFDLGGVLIRICRNWAEGCAAAGLEVRGRSGDETFRAVRRRIANEYGVGRLTCDEFAESISAALDGLYTPAEIRRVHDAWLLGEYDGAAALVARLNAVPCVVTACLSNTNHGHWQALPSYPVVRALRHRFASHIVGLAKPDPAIYRKFEMAMKAAPDEILFFDDLPENVEAARACRWNAERIDFSRPTAPQIESHLTAHGLL